MSVSALNNYYRIEDLVVDRDSAGCYLSCRLIHCRNWVLCISERGPILRQNLHLTQQELSRLFNGDILRFPEQGITLQGVSGNVFVGGNPRYRNAILKPPAYVHAWCMDAEGSTLFVPDEVDGHCVMVPMEYSCETRGNELRVQIDEVSGYHDGELRYQIGDHLPIPLPKEWLNQWIRLRTVSDIRVFPAEEVRTRYKQTVK